MAGVATLHIRNVPDAVVAVLKARAARNGRSLNSETVMALTDAAERRTVDEVLAEIDRIQATIKNPPTGEQIVEDLRRAREERGEHLWRVATRPRDE